MSGLIKMKQGKGFTLVEVLVTLVIFSIIYMAVIMCLSTGRTSFYTGDTKIAVQQEIRKAFLVMNQELRQSRPSLIVGVPADGNNYSTITFNIPADADGDEDVIDDDSGNVEWSENITYTLNGNNQITRTTASTGATIIANNITNLQFRRLATSPNIIQISVNCQKATVLGRNLSDTILSSVTMRN